MKAANVKPDENDLNDALSALARLDGAQTTPSHVEDVVMRGWPSVRGRKTMAGRLAVARKPALAWAASVLLALSIGGWWVARQSEPSRGENEQAAGEDVSAWHSSDLLPWLDPNPDSLQIVRLRVASETLRTQGYAVSDPDGDGAVEIEMVLGSDGMARSVLLTSAETPIN